jgi:hypothetical protein
MSETIPGWITNLALDIYKIIQKYNALPHFQEMVNKWAEEHEAEIEKRKEWQNKRAHHFEQSFAENFRLLDEKAGPPEKDWQWEIHILHSFQSTVAAKEHTSKIISAWVPPELSISGEPKITHILPLSREHDLNLPEKYALLTAIYDAGRRGTEEIKLWPWPGPDKWDNPNALSNAKKCMFFEGLRRDVYPLINDDEKWLRLYLNDVEKDIACRKEPNHLPLEKVLQTSPVTNTLVLNVAAREPSLVFISYCREDRKWLVDIREGLDPLIRQKRIKVWIDEEIEPGKEWRPEIEAAIHNATGALLLVSRHYLASDFVNDVEAPWLLDARTKRELKILWVLVGDCMWEETFLKDIQAAIEPNTALNNITEGERDQFIKHISEVVRDTFAT